jgi:hypothetical protein
MIDVLLAAVTAVASCPQLPLAPETSWTYRAEVAWTLADSDSVQRKTILWTTTVLTLETRDSINVATVKDWPTGLAWWEPNQPDGRSILLCAAGRIYHIKPLDGISVALVDSLLTGLRQPSSDELILRFPLHSSDLFGRDAADREDTLYAWYVESAQSIPDGLARMQAGLSDSLYTLAYRSLPDHQLVDFVPGLGITRYVYGHHGTVAQADAVLVDFRPGRSKR